MAEARRPDLRDPFIVTRETNRIGNPWDHGLIIGIAQTCLILFGKQLLGTVATLSKVALNRGDITKGAVQGVVKRRFEADVGKRLAER
jgi:hypothetical protein